MPQGSQRSGAARLRTQSGLGAMWCTALELAVVSRRLASLSAPCWRPGSRATMGSRLHPARKAPAFGPVPPLDTGKEQRTVPRKDEAHHLRPAKDPDVAGCARTRRGPLVEDAAAMRRGAIRVMATSIGQGTRLASKDSAAHGR